jgi:hypothetical protein
MGIRAGVSIDKLSPFLQNLRCPEIDLSDSSDVAKLIGEIHGVSTKPALGAASSFATPAPLKIGRWSNSAIAVARYLVSYSKNGMKFDPMTTPAAISAAIGLAEQDVRFGVIELRDEGLLEESKEINGDTFWPETALFVEFDGHFLDFIPKNDAVTVAHRLVNENVRQIEIKALAGFFPAWSARRINSALNYMEYRKLIKPIHGIGSAPFTMSCLFVTEYTQRFARDNV